MTSQVLFCFNQICPNNGLSCIKIGSKEWVHAVSLHLKTSLFNLPPEILGEIDARIAVKEVFWRQKYKSCK
jgi:hypothetical protein